MRESDYAVVCRNACKTYGVGNPVQNVLNRLNMNVPKGSIYGLLGASGCGKTTLLSCIAGIRQIDSGEITVLGGTPGTKGSVIPGPRIGYMPQDVSLLGEMTARNTLFYFGWMFGMSSVEITERFNFLAKLLELPPGDQLIKNLSGGQQRRVSLAASLVQTPDLLLLDEPTVGLDPVLRQSIWDYLVAITRGREMTIIITTHYIEEATQAHKIGLLREGVLLDEAAPRTLIARYNCTTLEETFLLLSSNQERLSRISKHEEATSDAAAEVKEAGVGSGGKTMILNEKEVQLNGRRVSFDDRISEKQVFKKPRPPTSTTNRMKALLYKDLLSYFRNVPGLLFTFIFPIIQISVFFIAVGDDSHSLSLGVVNDEYSNCSQMIDELRLVSGVILEGDEENNTCHLYGQSCLFIDHVSDDRTFNVISYADEHTALAAAKKNRNQATLHIPHNFSFGLKQRYEDGTQLTDEMFEKSEIKIWLDMSNYIIGYQLKKFIYDKYFEFSDKISDGCNVTRKFSHLPVKFEKPVHGTESTSYRDSTVPGVLILIVYFLSAMMTGTNMITERTNGLWDRNRVAGAKVSEIVLSHVLCNMIGTVIQAVEFVILVFVIIDTECKGSVYLVICLVCLQSLAGIAYGIFLGALSRTSTEAIYILVSSFFPYSFIIGVIWPIQGMHIVLQYITYGTPSTVAVISILNIILKGHGFLNSAVYPGFLLSIGWIFLPCLGAVLLLQRK